MSVRAHMIHVPDPDMDVITEWLEQHELKPTLMEVLDVSDVSPYYDTMLTVCFASEDDALMFKLTWIPQ